MRAMLIRPRPPREGLCERMAPPCACAGLRVSFNGTRGRLDYHVVESTCVAGAATDPNLPHRAQQSASAPVQEEGERPTGESVRIVVQRHWGEPVEHHVPCDEAGHGGGDARMLRDLFVGDETDTLGRKADHTAGVAAVSVGIAAAESYRTGAAVLVSSALSPRGLGSRRSIWWAAAAAVGGTALLLISALVVKRGGMRGGSNSGRSRH